jgi:hypothetical protein
MRLCKLALYLLLFTFLQPGRVSLSASVDKWQGGMDQPSPMDDSPTVVFNLRAENEIEGWLTKKRPTLIVRCRERKTDVYVVTGMAAQPESGHFQEATVQIRFDDSTAFQEQWGESTNNEALFAPTPIQMAIMIAKARMMRFRFTPFNSGPAIIVFDVRGFDRHIGLVSKTCSWE